MKTIKKILSLRGLSFTPVSIAIGPFSRGGLNFSLIRIGIYYQPGKILMNVAAALFSFGVHKLPGGNGEFEKYLHFNLFFFIRWCILLEKVIVLDIKDFEDERYG